MTLKDYEKWLRDVFANCSTTAQLGKVSETLYKIFKAQKEARRLRIAESERDLFSDIFSDYDNFVPKNIRDAYAESRSDDY